MNILHLLTVVFITLKLVGVIAWSWWLVLLPIIVEVVLICFLALLAIIGAALSKR